MADNAKTHMDGTAEANLPIVALENGGGVRDSIPAGGITQGQVSTVLPFGNIISMKEITASDLYTILENGVSKIAGQNSTTGKITGADGRFPQVSRMRFTYDPNAAAGSRIKQIVLLNADGTDKQILNRNDTSTKLVFATNDFEDAGGDGYTTLSGLKTIAEGAALDVITANYITKLTQAGDGTFSYVNSQGRICVSTGYVYPHYSASVTLTNTSGPIANSQVLYNVDNTSAAYGTTDANGVLTVPDLTVGPHSIYIYGNADYAAAYVNDTIGMTAVSSDMSAMTDEQKIAYNMMQTILALPTTISSGNIAEVQAAETAYNNLTIAEKALVGNAPVLLSDEKTVSSLISGGKIISNSSSAVVPQSSSESHTSSKTVSSSASSSQNSGSTASSMVSKPVHRW